MANVAADDADAVAAWLFNTTLPEWRAFIDGLDLITPGTSLGDVVSLVLYPPLSSHRTLSPEEQQAVGIGPGLVRMSVGLEHIES